MSAASRAIPSRYNVRTKKLRNASSKGPEEAQEGYDLFLTPPRLFQRVETLEGDTRLYFCAGALPSTAWLVERRPLEVILMVVLGGIAQVLANKKSRWTLRANCKGSGDCGRRPVVNST